MKEIIAIVNRRGGVGKTATSHALGAGLSLKGNRVLYIDLDSQCNLSFDLGVTRNPMGALEILTGTATAKEVIQQTSGGNIIPATSALSGADLSIDGTGKEYRLKEALQPILNDYDYIIIDTPPALGVLTVNALTACNSVIIPAQAEIHSLQGIGLIMEAIEPVKKYCNHDLKIRGFLLTRYNNRAVLSRDMRENLEALAEQLDTKVFKTAIRECTAIKEAQATQQDIFTYSPKSNASLDYMELVKEVLGEA